VSSGAYALACGGARAAPLQLAQPSCEPLLSLLLLERGSSSRAVGARSQGVAPVDEPSQVSPHA
jgi:hypothetical protein